MSVAVPQPSTVETLLELKSRYLIPCVYHFYRNPPVIVRGEGAYLIDHTGRRYLDCYSGVSAMAAGHCQAEIIDAAIAQIRTLQHTTTIYLTEPMLRLAEAIADVAPGDLGQSFFCASGSEAIEGAMLLATLHTKRSDFVALPNSLHGRTRWAMNATGLDMWRTDPFPLPGIVRAAEGFDAARLRDQIRQYGPERLAGLILEPIQGNGGIVVLPDEYLVSVREICDEFGLLLIADEVQTGFSRTGRWFGVDYAGVVPDVLVVAKALGNGFPIAAFITRADIAASYTRPGGSTFGGNPVSAAAARAVLEFHRRERLAERATTLGKRLLDQLYALALRQPWIREVRGRGLMIGMELDVTCEQMDDLQERLKELGVLAGKTGPGRNVLTLIPPLIVDEAALDDLVEKIEQTLGELA